MRTTDGEIEGSVAKVIDLGSGDRFRRLIELIADGIVVVDGSGVIRFVNPAAERLLGRSSSDLVGRMFGFPITTASATEIEIVRSDGSRGVVEMRVAELEWEDQPARVASIRDVTERTALVQQQRDMIERLRELDELKTEFVSMVSHDLRSPMAAIAGFADTLRYNWDAFDDPHKLSILERISRNTNQLARFVENILQVSQIEAGKLSYDIQHIDLKEIVERVAEENTRVGPTQEKVAIETRIPDHLPLVRGDEMRQWQILTNLVTNALKFAPAGSPVEIGVAVDGDVAVVSVHDSGPGIDVSDFDKLFKKFSRLGQPPGSNIKGTGLGLYICKAMVEAQGGRVWVDSEPGTGTTFSYTVPLAR